MTSLQPFPTCETPGPDLQPAVDCFLAVIADVAECLTASGGELATPHLSQFARIRNRLAFEPSLLALEEGRDTLHLELASFAAKARRRREGCSEELSQILILMAQTADALALRKDGFADQFRHFSRMLEQVQVDRLGDPGEKVSAQIESLRQFANAVGQENQRSFSQVREHIEDLRVRLHESAAQDSLDPVTGLPVPVEFEGQLAARIASGRPFTILDFVIEDAAGVFERLGQPGLDAVLKLTGNALACQVRARDVVGRWGNGGFLVLLECDAKTARLRSKQIAQWLSGQYHIECNGAASLVDVRLAVSVIEPEPGASEKEILAAVRPPH